jgi:pyridoxamine 5'-phosphate oxidase-like protein
VKLPQAGAGTAESRDGSGGDDQHGMAESLATAGNGTFGSCAGRAGPAHNRAAREPGKPSEEGGGMSEGGRQMKPMTRQQALDKLASAAFGRVVFTQHAMPALRQVNHVIHNGRIIIRSHPDSAITAHADHGRGTVVLYEADDIDPRTRTGWTVTVTGLARLVENPAQAARYKTMVLPWIGGNMSDVISIDPEIVTGFELTETAG